jgi:hypothetical protein
LIKVLRSIDITMIHLRPIEGQLQPDNAINNLGIRAMNAFNVG